MRIPTYPPLPSGLMPLSGGRVYVSDPAGLLIGYRTTDGRWWPGVDSADVAELLTLGAVRTVATAALAGTVIAGTGLLVATDGTLSLARPPLRTVTDTAPLGVADYGGTVVVQVSGKTVTLPKASDAGAGTLITIINGASGATTTVASAEGTINGATTQTLTAAYNALTAVSTGTLWLLRSTL